VDAGAGETILLRDGMLTEASAAAVHVVIAGEIRTPPNSTRILPGTTRSAIEELAERARLPHRSVPVSESELRGAEEIWLSAATREVEAVTSLDGRPIGSGEAGPLWARIHAAFQSYKRELAAQPW
jgi:D-alanine transaminase